MKPELQGNYSSDKTYMTFLNFLKAKDQRVDWLILISICIIGYIVLHICYPYPATMSDSATYVDAAERDSFIFYRPFGYSYFLQITHLFSSSIHAIFIIQLFIYFLSIATFSFTIKYSFPPKSKVLWRVFLFAFFFSPTAFYMANSIMSDLLFASLIFVLLASFIFIVKESSWVALAIFAITLFSLLHVRYSAIIFPVLFLLLFFMVKGSIRWVSIITTILVTFVFYYQVRSSMKEANDIDQYSTGFDGWQLANNALHVLPFTQADSEHIKSRSVRSMDMFMRQYNDIILISTKNGTQPIASFMWNNELPLKQYLFAYMNASREPYSSSWIKLGSGPYKKYGWYLIRKHPILFMKHYYIPNAKDIFYPDNQGIIKNYEKTKNDNIHQWYNIPANISTDAQYPIYDRFIADFITISTQIVWIIMAAICSVTIFYRKKMKFTNDDRNILVTIVLFGLLYYSSTVFASPIELRFWTPMGAVQFAICYILLNKIIEIQKKIYQSK